MFESENTEFMIDLLWKIRFYFLNIIFVRIPASNDHSPNEYDPPFIISLLKTLLRLCFLKGFTIDDSQIEV